MLVENYGFYPRSECTFIQPSGSPSCLIMRYVEKCRKCQSILAHNCKLAEKVIIRGDSGRLSRFLPTTQIKVHERLHQSQSRDALSKVSAYFYFQGSVGVYTQQTGDKGRKKKYAHMVRARAREDKAEHTVTGTGSRKTQTQDEIQRPGCMEVMRYKRWWGQLSGINGWEKLDIAPIKGDRKITPQPGERSRPIHGIEAEIKAAR